MRYIVFIAVLAVFMTGYAVGEPAIGAKGAILIEAETGRTLLEKNCDQKLPMASTTKIMTCLLALENCELTDNVTTGKNAYGVTGTSIYLGLGEELSLEQMLYGLMLRSGNDAAVAIAEHVAGDVPSFVEMMNARAAEIGADASFANPHGLNTSGHAASARAMAMIMREALKNEDFRRITETTRKVIPWEGNEYSRVLYNKNRLLTSYEGAGGGKTGYTSQAGRCLVFSATRDGMQLIGAVLNCSTWFDTAAAMLDHGFEKYSMVRFVECGDIAGVCDISGGEQTEATLTAGGAIAYPLSDEDAFELKSDIPREVAAPVRKGDQAGSIALIVNGEIVSECPLLFAETVEAKNMETAIKRIMRNWEAAGLVY